jgi:hypothetical protein
VLHHDLTCLTGGRITILCYRTCTLNFGTLAQQVLSQRRGHGASARVAGAHEQDTLSLFDTALHQEMEEMGSV